MAKKLWGGRFGKTTDPIVEEFTKSIQYDYKIGQYDILGSIIHVNILQKAGYLKPAEARKLIQGLKFVGSKIPGHKFTLDHPEEDIHTWIQNELYKKTGDLALKLHTARSRNDQVVFATKLYCQDRIKDILQGIGKFDSALTWLVKKNKDIIIPGFTHLQHAQPVYLSNYLLAYSRMLQRDQKKLNYIYQAIGINFGAGALAGTPIDAAHYNIKIEGIAVKQTVNSLDQVSDRDFVIDIVSALSVLAMHLSRLSEDLIIWSTKEFDFVELDDAYCTGSSLMPQKKNPDVLEIIRGYAGRLNGNLVSVLTMMKGLPLAYNRDMQLDKEPLFNSFEIISAELKVMAGVIKTLSFNKENIARHLADESLYATDLVYYLVDKGVPFAHAHSLVGRLVKYSLDNSIQIRSMSQEEFKQICPKFIKKEMVKLFDPAVSVRSKRSIRR